MPRKERIPMKPKAGKVMPYTTVYGGSHLLKYATYGYSKPKKNPFNAIRFFKKPLNIRKK